MSAMTQVQMEAFLAPPRHAIVATNAPDGPPQLSPVWYIYENNTLYISVSASTAKARHLRRDSRLSVCIDGGHPDARYVIIQGKATLLETDDPAQEAMRWRIIQHYYETEAEAQRYYASVRERASILIVVTPERIISQDLNT
ncbi:MAG: PPOX class F420-dependent oxidoreductase [Chloroflexi bacterium]|nr:PPOX class F420-dependent oxidoreductase [Chloroflexota bacterium]